MRRGRAPAQVGGWIFPGSVPPGPAGPSASSVTRREARFPPKPVIAGQCCQRPAEDPTSPSKAAHDTRGFVRVQRSQAIAGKKSADGHHGPFVLKNVDAESAPRRTINGPAAPRLPPRGGRLEPPRGPYPAPGPARQRCKSVRTRAEKEPAARASSRCHLGADRRRAPGRDPRLPRCLCFCLVGLVFVFCCCCFFFFVCLGFVVCSILLSCVRGGFAVFCCCSCVFVIFLFFVF